MHVWMVTVVWCEVEHFVMLECPILLYTIHNMTLSGFWLVFYLRSLVVFIIVHGGLPSWHGDGLKTKNGLTWVNLGICTSTLGYTNFLMFYFTRIAVPHKRQFTNNLCVIDIPDNWLNSLVGSCVSWFLTEDVTRNHAIRFIGHWLSCSVLEIF